MGDNRAYFRNTLYGVEVLARSASLYRADAPLYKAVSRALDFPPWMYRTGFTLYIETVSHPSRGPRIHKISEKMYGQAR